MLQASSFRESRPATSGLAAFRRLARRPRRWACCLALGLCVITSSPAEVLRPLSDAEVVETLPNAGSQRSLALTLRAHTTRRSASRSQTSRIHSVEPVATGSVPASSARALKAMPCLYSVSRQRSGARRGTRSAARTSR